MNWTSFFINCHISLPFCEMVQIANKCNWWTFRFHMGVHIMHRLWLHQAKKVLHIGTVKNDPHNFAILNSHVTVMILRFIKNTFFNVVKQKKTVTIKWHLSENLTFQNLLKNRKLLSAEKFGKILAFDKESKRKLLSLISTDSFS